MRRLTARTVIKATYRAAGESGGNLGAIAQMVEYLPCKQEVEGSMPSRSNSPVWGEHLNSR